MIYAENEDTVSQIQCFGCRPALWLFEIPIIEKPHILAGTRLHPLVPPV